MDEFGNVRADGTALAELAKPQLNDLLRLIIGKPAPEMEGEDLEGRPLRLSDYRGQTVLLNFWGECGGCRPEVPPLQKLLEQFKGKPFAIVGVFCDKDYTRGKAIAEELGMLWPSFRDGRSGPLSTLWNNNEWPVFELIDPQGTIRCRNLSRVDVPAAVEKLMKE
jgi:thiol-disulfide isomerase/thioredoxin